jgi:hypothetical protein
MDHDVMIHDVEPAQKKSGSPLHVRRKWRNGLPKNSLIARCSMHVKFNQQRTGKQNPTDWLCRQPQSFVGVLAFARLHAHT